MLKRASASIKSATKDPELKKIRAIAKMTEDQPRNAITEELVEKDSVENPDLKKIKFKSMEKSKDEGMYTVSWSQLSKKISNEKKWSKVTKAVDSADVKTLADLEELKKDQPSSLRGEDFENDDSHCAAMFENPFKKKETKTEGPPKPKAISTKDADMEWSDDVSDGSEEYVDIKRNTHSEDLRAESLQANPSKLHTSSTTSTDKSMKEHQIEHRPRLTWKQRKLMALAAARKK